MQFGNGDRIVEYSSPDEAQKAIKELSDTPLLGRSVFIREVSRWRKHKEKKKKKRRNLSNFCLIVGSRK